MITSRIGRIVFDIEKYVNIHDFNHFTNGFLMAAAAGMIEGNIQINKKHNFVTLLDIYNIEFSNTDFIFLSMFNLVKNHSEIYNFIVKYFNMWHSGKFDKFTYDNYHINDLKNNFNELVFLIQEELKCAIKDNNYEVVGIYEGFIDGLAEELR